MMKTISEHIKSVLLVVLVTLSLGLGTMTWINNKSLQSAKIEIGELSVKAENFERELKQTKQAQAQMVAALKKISVAQGALTTKQNKITKDLKDVSQPSKTWLDTPIPSDVGSVLDTLHD